MLPCCSTPLRSPSTRADGDLAIRLIGTYTSRNPFRQSLHHFSRLANMSAVPCFCQAHPQWCKYGGCAHNAMGLSAGSGTRGIYCIVCVRQASGLTCLSSWVSLSTMLTANVCCWPADNDMPLGLLGRGCQHEASRLSQTLPHHCYDTVQVPPRTR